MLQPFLQDNLAVRLDFLSPYGAMHRTGRRAGHGVEFFYDAILTAPSGRFRICRRTTDQPLHHADVPLSNFTRKPLLACPSAVCPPVNASIGDFSKHAMCGTPATTPSPFPYAEQTGSTGSRPDHSPAGNKNLRRRVLRCRPVANFQRIQVTTASRIDSIPKPRLPDHHVFGSRRSLVDSVFHGPRGLIPHISQCTFHFTDVRHLHVIDCLCHYCRTLSNVTRYSPCSF